MQSGGFMTDVCVFTSGLYNFVNFPSKKQESYSKKKKKKVI